jgi:general secretion pathway protein G
MTRRSRRRAAFTLLEVLLVLTILVILASTVTMFLIPQQQRAYRKQAINQIGNLEQMLTAYRLDVGAYPNTNDGLMALLQPPAELMNTSRWGGPYAPKEIPPDPWGNPYQYQLIGPEQYLIWSWGPDSADGTEDDVRSDTMM